MVQAYLFYYFWGMALTMMAVAMALGSGKKSHILMIASDDMRPEMSPYGSRQSSPNQPDMT